MNKGRRKVGVGKEGKREGRKEGEKKGAEAGVK